MCHYGCAVIGSGPAGQDGRAGLICVSEQVIHHEPQPIRGHFDRNGV